ncbi:hypothetical protein FB451DRAFT_149984 [Mycena latifolia]|nr:hypothetical protein FB451DRAFT_149984 [Mycena latifolia]
MSDLSKKKTDRLREKTPTKKDKAADKKKPENLNKEGDRSKEREKSEEDRKRGREKAYAAERAAAQNSDATRKKNRDKRDKPSPSASPSDGIAVEETEDKPPSLKTSKSQRALKDKNRNESEDVIEDKVVKAKSPSSKTISKSPPKVATGIAEEVDNSKTSKSPKSTSPPKSMPLEDPNPPLGRGVTLRTNLQKFYNQDYNPAVIIPLFYEIVEEFYEDSGALEAKSEEHITLQLSLELARDFTYHKERKLKPKEKLWTALTSAVDKNDDTPGQNWKKQIRTVQEAEYMFHVAPSNKSFEAQAGFDVVWFFNKKYTLYLQAKLGSKKKPAKITYK